MSCKTKKYNTVRIVTKSNYENRRNRVKMDTPNTDHIPDNVILV